ncbi:hypothetical protein EV702DRAFT_462357 [Suillus placidus]|uniref:Uncharacterized protein n=1 Tax=Suillus placidus TaxID=48579 RepID=A0A9P6ZQY1_9AGAM|nr:hypothetical protein EV702DRAFT_462357 [Suillus placidus]
MDITVNGSAIMWPYIKSPSYSCCVTLRFVILKRQGRRRKGALHIHAHLSSSTFGCALVIPCHVASSRASCNTIRTRFSRGRKHNHLRLGNSTSNVTCAPNTSSIKYQYPSIAGLTPLRTHSDPSSGISARHCSRNKLRIKLSIIVQLPIEVRAPARRAPVIDHRVRHPVEQLGVPFRARHVRRGELRCTKVQLHSCPLASLRGLARKHRTR